MFSKPNGQHAAPGLTDLTGRPNNAVVNECVQISTEELIALRHAAESLSLHTGRIRSLQGQNYLSPFKGRGMEFDESRPYQAGDDVRSLDWQLTLMARKAGTYTIPAIRFGKDHSNSISLVVNEETVSSTAQDEPIILEAEVDPEKIYVQQQVIYKVRLLRSVNISNANLSEPTFSGIEAIIETLGDDRNFETRINGVRYLVLERTYAIFPQQPGVLKIEPTVFQGQIIQGNRFSFSNTLRAKRLTSRSFDLEVLPILATARQPWLPSRELRLEEHWPQDPPRFRVGEPLTRTLTITASGITAEQLPTLEHSLPNGLKQYADQPVTRNQMTTNGVLGKRQEKIAVMPSQAGTFKLPAIEIPWWNTQTGKQEVARIPARTIEVATVSGTPNLPSTETVEVIPAVSVETNAIAAQPVTASYWPWLSLAFAVAWLSTVLLWWRHTGKQRASTVTTIDKPAADFRTLKRACQNSDAQTCKSALLAWAQNQWPDKPPTSLSAIAARVDKEFAETINGLGRALYAPDSAGWDGAAILRAARHWHKSENTRQASKASPIEPLNPVRES